MEVLQCYNPHRTERFCTIGVLQRCYSGATGCYKGKAKVYPFAFENGDDMPGDAQPPGNRCCRCHVR